MLFSELLEMIKIGTGQTLVEIGELTTVQYRAVVQRQVLPLFREYSPTVVLSPIDVVQTPYVFGGTPPEKVIRLLPLDTLSPSNILAQMFRYQRSVPTDIPTLLFRYEKPCLYTEYTGRFQAECLYYPTLTASGDDYEFTSLDAENERLLIELSIAYCGVFIGRARRAATLQDLPIDLDKDALISESLQKIEELRTELQNRSKWWLAVA